MSCANHFYLSRRTPSVHKKENDCGASNAVVLHCVRQARRWSCRVTAADFHIDAFKYSVPSFTHVALEVE